MYSRTAECYDKVYAYKDYPAEARALTAFLRQELRSGGSRLLDVACGTGLHVGCLAEEWQVEGVDLSAEMLARAGRRAPCCGTPTSMTTPVRRRPWTSIFRRGWAPSTGKPRFRGFAGVPGRRSIPAGRERRIAG